MGAASGRADVPGTVLLSSPPAGAAWLKHPPCPSTQSSTAETGGGTSSGGNRSRATSRWLQPHQERPCQKLHALAGAWAGGAVLFPLPPAMAPPPAPTPAQGGGGGSFSWAVPASAHWAPTSSCLPPTQAGVVLGAGARALYTRAGTAWLKLLPCLPSHSDAAGAGAGAATGGKGSRTVPLAWALVSACSFFWWSYSWCGCS